VLEVVLGKASGDANAAVSTLLGGLPGADADAEAEAAAGAGLQGSDGERLMTDRQIARVQRQVNRRQQLAEFREEALQLQRMQRAADAQNGRQQETGADAMQPEQPGDAGAAAPTAAAAEAAPEASLVAPAAPSASRQLLDRAAASVRYLWS
jgi:hypothetical protein